jgi:hypothetical protein
MIQLSIKRRDKEPIDHNHWRILQRIKNDLLGPEVEGVELFPAESRLTDSANQYSIWCLRGGLLFPFGYRDGRVLSEKSIHGAKQRPWPPEERPADLDEVQARFDPIFRATMGIQGEKE